MNLRFAMIGAAGFVAPRHMKAIAETGNQLMVAYDPNDSVGIIDSHFPDAEYFIDYERFDQYVDTLRRAGDDQSIQYVAVCSPNFLHDAHIRFGLRSNANVICEKPIVLHPEDLEALCELEAQSPTTVNTILQLRLHPSIIQLREKVRQTDKKYDIRLTYITSRGKWYAQSWKGEVPKSGGIATNIGVHFFDMIHWIFGETQSSVLHYADPQTNAGFLECERARVQWLLSIDERRLPAAAVDAGMRTFRSIEIDGDELEFSAGFTDLHTRSYQEILAGRGFPLSANRQSIRTVSELRNATPIGLSGDVHPGLK